MKQLSFTDDLRYHVAMVRRAAEARHDADTPARVQVAKAALADAVLAAVDRQDVARRGRLARLAALPKPKAIAVADVTARRTRRRA